ncbi:MAG: hypothetical protein V4437_03180 [Patescibacteria group bacterium]
MTPKAWKRLFARIVLWAGLFFALLFVVLLSLATWRVFVKERAARQEHLDEAKTLTDLKERKTTLEGQLQRLNTERGIEEEVRKRFPVAKPGEEEIMLVASKPSLTSTSTAKAGFWNTIFGWFSW